MPLQRDEGETLPENYLIKFVISDKDQKTEFSLVAAATKFSADTMDGKTRINGTLTLEEGDKTVFFQYALSTTVEIVNSSQTLPGSKGSPGVTTKSISYQQRDINSAVRLRFDEPIQIYKFGALSCELTLSRLPESAKKDK